MYYIVIYIMTTVNNFVDITILNTTIQRDIWLQKQCKNDIHWFVPVTAVPHQSLYPADNNMNAYNISGFPFTDKSFLRDSRRIELTVKQNIII